MSKGNGQYLIEGGVDNFANGFKFIANICLNTNYIYQQPQSIPRLGIYSIQ
ncbi:hypothetical protein [Geminocystis sp. GBBB08]|uniref:hypothetical protein n=1 Tax=Geminocystis sp. GBBB08 TaxID=2604140 RepID=UPI0027E2FFEB|nr:hypothetical protein [Geminocystis sp. GBBB08]